MKTKIFTVLFLIPLLYITSCKKEDMAIIKTGQVSVHMTDTLMTNQYEQINIDIRSIEVRIAGSTGGDWHTLHTNAGVYDLCRCAGGIDTLIANEVLPTGEIMQLRMNLGSNNSVKKNGTLYPLILTEDEKPLLTIEAYKVINENAALLQLNFDAGQSVVSVGSDSYHLHPMLSVIGQHQ